MITQPVDTTILDRFVRLTHAKRLAHAYLFVGPNDALKQETAMAVAQLVNCAEAGSGPCGQCPSCLKIASGNHPDVHVLGDDEEEGIKIEHVRGMLGRVGLRAFEAIVKVFILLKADLMNKESSNCLLKTLEEPAGNTLIILTTSAPHNCLDTIRSRCHTVNFFEAQVHLPAKAEEILDVFITRGASDEFVKELSADKQRAGEAMQVLFTFVRDAAMFRAGVNEKHLVFRNRIRDIETMSHRGMDDLCALTTQIVRTKELVNENLNVKMALSLVRQRLWGN